MPNGAQRYFATTQRDRCLALAWHSRGRGFDSPYLHRTTRVFAVADRPPNDCPTKYGSPARSLVWRTLGNSAELRPRNRHQRAGTCGNDSALVVTDSGGRP